MGREREGEPVSGAGPVEEVGGEEGRPGSRRWRGWAKVVAAAGVVVVLGVGALWLPVGEWLRGAIGWVESLGWWAPVAFVLVYVVAVVFLVPGSALTALAGALFGVLWGTVYVSVASVAGATLAFLIGRYLARGAVERRIAGSRRFEELDRAVGREGWKIVGLTRLSPVFPFTLLNYGYGVTRVKLRDYVLASWVGMAPGTVLYVYLGSLGKAAAEAGERSVAEWAIYATGLVATVVVTVFITRIARRALGRKVGGDVRGKEIGGERVTGPRSPV